MKKIYKYNDKLYDSSNQVRQAIWNKEHKVFGSPKTPAEWLQYGVAYSEIDAQLSTEQLAQQARLKRNHLLTACDYYMMLDYPSTEQNLVEVKNYRQALRDITNQKNFPNEIIWPNKPDILRGNNVK